MSATRCSRRVRQLSKACWNTVRRGTIILAYHRIAALPTDPFRLAVKPDNFAAHLEILKKAGEVLPLRTAVKFLHNGKLPRRTIVITFDDGYADNFHAGLPLLEKHDAPATIFLATHLLGTEAEFWWDELERLVLQPGRLPSTLHWIENGSRREWDLGVDSHYSPEQFERHREWDVSCREDPSGRHTLFRHLWKYLHKSDHTGRSSILTTLRAQAEITEEGRPTHRVLTEKEVQKLTSGSLVEAGAHSVTHSSLATLSLNDQRREIHNSRTRIEELIGRPCRSFSYPFGSYNDYSTETIEAVQGAGFLSACANTPAIIRGRGDLYQLPRFLVPDWDGDTFARNLARWFRS